MATATLKPPAFASQPPGGVTDFWSIAVAPGGWQTVGDSDLGVCLQDLDTLRVFAVQDGFSPIGSGAALFFADEGAIPPGSIINSIQLVVTANWVGINMTDAIQPFNLQTGVIPSITLIGADTDDFTGSGTFQSAVMTINPATGVAWVFDDLYGAELPFSDPKGFQGWWGVNAYGGTFSPVGTQAYEFDQIVLEVSFTPSGIVPPTNWTMNAVFGGKEFGVVRLT